jgi:hypothetical protein
VVCHSDHGAEERVTDSERAVTQASALVVAHLKACPDDVRLSRARSDDGPSLYAAVRATFPELERMLLTSAMWDQVAGQALAEFLADRGDGDAL